MRDSLTILAIVLIVLLTAALVAPYFIDWNSHRALIEARLTQAAGVTIRIDGPIDVKLLPQPTFRLGSVTIGNTGPGQEGITAARLDAQIALTALMRGDIQVVDATLQQPHLDLSAAANGTLRTALPKIADPQRVGFQHFAVIGGTVTISDPDRGPITLSGLDLDGDATSLLGPFKVAGRAGVGADRYGFHLATGAYESGRTRVKFGIDGARDRPAIDLDGTFVAAGPAGPTKVKAAFAGPHVEGTLTVSGAIPLPATTAAVPWRLTSALKADRDTATLGDIELRAGTDMRALVATGSGDAAFGNGGDLRLRLRGSQVNFDTLAVAPDTSTSAAPQGIDLITRLARMLEDPRTTSTVRPRRLDLEYGFDTASAGNQSIFGLAGHLHLDGDTPALVAFSASGPEGARLALDGQLEGGSAPIFRGHLDASLRDLPHFAAWLAPAFPDAADWVKRTVPGRAVSFRGTVDLSGVGGAARDATFTLDQTTLQGTLSYTQAVGDDRARLFADLSAEALNLEEMPDPGGAGLDWTDLDLDISLDARAVRIGSPSSPATASAAPLDAGQLTLQLHKTGPDARLDRLSATLGGAQFNATGSLDTHSANAKVTVDVLDLGPLADLLARLAPNRASALLKERAAALSPARFDLDIAAIRGTDGSLLPNIIAVSGTVNGTDLSAEVKPDNPGDLDPATATISGRLSAKSQASLTLLRQLGVPLRAGPAGAAPAGAAPAGAAPALSAPDPGQIDATAHGSFAAGFDTTMDATLSGATVSFRGKAKPDLGNGHLSLGGGDLAPLLVSAGLLAGSGGTVWPVQGDADISWHDSSVALRHLSGTLAEVAFGGDLNTDLAPPPAAQATRPVLFGTLSIDRLDLATLFGLALGVSSPSGSTTDAGARWSERPFGPAVLLLPRTEIALKVGRLALQDGIEARAASFSLRAASGAVTLADLTGSVAGGSLGGSLTLRHDGAVASMAGTITLRNVALDLPGVVAQVGGSIDLAATGASPAALVANLAGTGSVIVSKGRLAAFDPAALQRTARIAEKNGSDVDADEVGTSLIAELDRAPLSIGDVAGPASLAGGMLRLGPLQGDGDGWIATTDVSLDLSSLEARCNTVLEMRQPLPGWTGDPAEVTVTLKGLPRAPERDVDATAFVNALQSRAIARDQERIDIIQQDIRERAFFNRRLKAIETDQKAARDKAKADAEARGAAEFERMLNSEKLRLPDIQGAKPPVGAATTGGGTTQSIAPGPPVRPSPLPTGRAGPAPGPNASPARSRPLSLHPPALSSGAPLGPSNPTALDPSVQGRY